MASLNKTILVYPGLILFIVLAMYACMDAPASEKVADIRPNIVMIIADDVGYSDIGCYGSEIQTPHLDRLASDGMRLRTFYNMAKCNPTRSSLITGLYQGGEQSISFVNLLRDAGYSAMMSGKEHFDKWVPQDCYFAETFENAFTFWATTEYFVPPVDTFQRPFYLNGRKLQPQEIHAEILPKYKTDFITDYALNYLDTMIDRDDPFFLLLPYHAAHYPLQARPEDIAKYRGKYRQGWDEIRAQRFERMKEIGILDQEVTLSPAEGNTNKFRGHPDGWDDIRDKFPLYYPWDSMSDEEKDKKDLEMAVFAAMVDRMDQNIGRVIERLEKEGKLENTLILFFSDNGSCPFDSNVDFDVPPGPAESYRCLSAAWANVGNTPFRLYKQNGHEGGSNTHFIAHWPAAIAANQIVDGPAHLVDLYPTFLEMAGAHYPASKLGIATQKLDGNSLMPIFKGEEQKVDHPFISGNTDRFRMYRDGDWKLVRQNAAEWELYNLQEDPTELNNLANDHPERVNQLAAGLAEYYD